MTTTSPVNAKAELEKPVESIQNEIIMIQMLNYINEERARFELGPLQLDEELIQAAQAKSEDMHNHRILSHTSPTYGSVADLLKHFDISYTRMGENIAQGQPTVQMVLRGWFNSEGHAANILNPYFTHIGIGYVEGTNYWTQLFIKK
ncbi:hypothetical protein AN639_04975 [Candidatus Epulonipiscium fishelsonii]|uniref:Uncharacterized protein n=1 Tax=Candidatus Epulonipiscium fishelsonii TaxID=77094 RepID=A0ACC8XFU4_9FIRM|nr:hypothetical protein AN639_04975 [Epulopiscium sp. SCG-B05WGA-EpuloA1]ONI42307.1 hypothetical protein AN396_01905 [Epulopiscium sp. SCG-B11WGA-EpuloA1]ONI47990.1 hypothetical protein AN644_03155 [Epulopiscium sp. SCG-C06WGA-EpuloA1]